MAKIKKRADTRNHRGGFEIFFFAKNKEEAKTIPFNPSVLIDNIDVNNSVVFLAKSNPEYIFWETKITLSSWSKKYAVISHTWVDFIKDPNGEILWENYANEDGSQRFKEEDPPLATN